MDELLITRVRLSQAGTGNGSCGADRALPYDWDASHVREDVGNTLTTWVRELDMGDLWVEEQGCWCAPYRPCQGWRRIPLPNTTRALCGWLLRRIERIRGHGAADELLDEICYQVDDVRRAIDNPPPLAYCGRCGICGREMYARQDDEQAVCRYCERVGIESVLPAQPMRADMWRRVEVMDLPRRLILQALPLYGREVNPATFRGWIWRGRLRPAGAANGAPLYSLRRALDLARHIDHAAPEITCALCWALVPQRDTARHAVAA